MRIVIGIALMIFALAIAIVPIFSDCQSQGRALTTTTGMSVPMKCHWSGIAEIGIAVPLLLVGGMMTLNRRKDSLRNLGVMGLILGSLAIYIPSSLIGVCQTPTMVCHTVMRPSLVTLGLLTIVLSIGAIVLTPKAQV